MSRGGVRPGLLSEEEGATYANSGGHRSASGAPRATGCNLGHMGCDLGAGRVHEGAGGHEVQHAHAAVRPGLSRTRAHYGYRQDSP